MTLQELIQLNKSKPTLKSLQNEIDSLKAENNRLSAIIEQNALAGTISIPLGLERTDGGDLT